MVNSCFTIQKWMMKLKKTVVIVYPLLINKANVVLVYLDKSSWLALL